MKNQFLLCFLFSFSVQFVLAQPTPAEVQKQFDDALKKAGLSNDPKAKVAMEELKKVKWDTASTPGTNNDPIKKTTALRPDIRKLPARNNSLLSSISQKIFTSAELVVYCNDLYKQLADKISPAKVKAVNEMMTKPGGNTYKYNLTAVASWYNGAAEEAILLATKAAVQNPADDVLLNNLAAMLNLGGLEQKAIPILKTLVQKYPENPMVLNNMGQAYEGLGDTETAMLYLGRCIARSPNHPEANNTAGHIELSKGNQQKAKEHFEQSLKGAYNSEASRALRYIDPETKFSKLIRPRVRIPEYFNFYKYKLPPQCESMSQAPAAKAEHEAFKEMLSHLIKKYDDIQKEESALTSQTLLEKYSIANIHTQSFPPFLELGTKMLTEVWIDYSNEAMELVRYNENFYVELKKLESGYNMMMNQSGCPAANAQYLPLFANLRRDWQIKNIALQKKYLDELIYWSYLASHNIHDFRKSFYALISSALTVLHGLADTKLPYYDCDWKEGGKQTAEEPVLTEPECPFTVELKFIFGKVALDCEKFSFSGGEGVIFKYEKKFTSNQSTISLGIGAQLELGGGFGGVNVSAGASASESLFITLDGNGHATDGGLKFEAKVAAGAKLNGAIGKTINIKKDISSTEISAGYTIGMESGIKFDSNEGPLKYLINQPATPTNKNVPIYKPGG
jgi:tetratricopeptide (TPR) repeat protein